MNREQWKAMLPIITAFVEGKTVQVKEPGGDWFDTSSLYFRDDDLIYRIKPTPTLRPWKPEEVPVGSVVRNKNTGLKTVILAAEARGNQGLSHVFIHGFTLTEEQMLDHWEILDGSPCGVEVSE